MDHPPVIACVVILFDPPKGVLDNIATYLPQVDQLFVMDNSPAPDPSLAKEVEKWKDATYIPMGSNKGIAAALNAGARVATERGCDYLLLMDHDSQADEGMVAAYRSYITSERGDLSSVAILSPFHFYKNYTTRVDGADVERSVAITSGTLLDLRAYREVGPFLEPLFIDYVDFEYCLRLRLRGYRIVRVGKAVLYHTLGDLTSRVIVGRKIGVTRHSPLRVYYRTRNRLFVARRYLFSFPGFVLFDAMVFCNELIKIIFFEEDAVDKCAMMLKGARDFLRNRYGEYGKA